MIHNLIRMFLFAFALNLFISPAGECRKAEDASEVRNPALLAKKYKQKHKHENYVYHYYPSDHIYFSPGEKVYFFRKGKKWQKSKHLPGKMHLKRNDYVIIHTNTLQPYIHYDEHKVKYKVKQVKKRKYKYYPTAGVYFDTHEKVYFYRKGKKWGKYKNAPEGILLKGADHVVLLLDTPRPYIFFDQHKAKYKPKAVRTYQYYPALRVYFDTRDKVYFCQHGKTWQKYKTLPKHIRLKDAKHVMIYTDTNTPYIYHEVHKTKFRSPHK